ncbi:MAG TPA: hypothetical protein VGQ83_41245 [Polyangia bacterium]|jgi:hypothetical protein
MSDEPRLPFTPQGHLEPGAERDEYQPDGASPRGLALFTIGLFVFIGVCLVASALLFRGLRSRPVSAVYYDQPLPRQAGPAAVWVNEPYDYQRWLRDEMEHLDRYQWIDRRRGLVQLPVERAMELLLAGHAASHPSGGGP